MSLDPFGALESLERAIGVPPAAIVAIVLLAGPTVVWVLYRFVVQPRTSRYDDTGLDLLWICERCRSANEVRSGRCYRCGLDREAMASGDLQVVDGVGVVTLTANDEVVPTIDPDGRPLVPVGPGHPAVPAVTSAETPADWTDVTPEPAPATPRRRRARAAATTRGSSSTTTTREGE